MVGQKQKNKMNNRKDICPALPGWNRGLWDGTEISICPNRETN